ncbi:hypothetical protein SAMN05720354_107101 [Nitrosospira sp. Nsp1]|nr:hypothetical protein SAMN05720354_107101 [Nitrosospira sp. Nsp1]
MRIAHGRSGSARHRFLIVGRSPTYLSAVYRQEDTGALSTTLGILEHLHVHFKLARSEVMLTRASTTLTLLPFSAPLLSVTSTSASDSSSAETAHRGRARVGPREDWPAAQVCACLNQIIQVG